LGTSRRNRTRGLTLLPLLRRFHAVFGGKLRRDDLRFEVHAGAWPLALRAMKQLRSHLFTASGIDRPSLSVFPRHGQGQFDDYKSFPRTPWRSRYEQASAQQAPV
jgi:hypothetical protein